MNELELLTRMRAEVPLRAPSADVANAMSAAIGRASAGHALSGTGQRSALSPGMRLLRRPGLRRNLLIGSAAAAIAVTSIAGWAATRGPDTPVGRMTVAWSGRPAAPLATTGLPSVGLARTSAQLVAFAARAAALASARAPGPHEWVYMKVEIANSTKGGGGFLFGPPNERQFYLSWVRVDWREYAGLPTEFLASMPPQTVVHTHLSVSPGGGGSLGGWKSVSYSYLNSLPTDPAGLRAVILSQNSPRMPWYQPDPNVAVFSAIAMLLTGQTEGVWLPPRLAATMYRLLQQTPGVDFDTAADLAGRTGLGFYMVMGGWEKEELVINPTTYSYMGNEWIAVRAHEDVGTDGTRHISKGQVLGWEALLASAIVRRPGQIP
jgi:hypothetical protein